MSASSDLRPLGPSLRESFFLEQGVRDTKHSKLGGAEVGPKFLFPLNVFDASLIIPSSDFAPRCSTMGLLFFVRGFLLEADFLFAR